MTLPPTDLPTDPPTPTDPLTRLAGRYPLLMADVSRWVRLHPAAGRVGAGPATPRVIDAGAAGVACVGRATAAWVADRVADVPAGRVLLHLFPDVAAFAGFLADPDAGRCVGAAAWVPVVTMPLADAGHTQAWLAGRPPEAWPWGMSDADPAATAFAAGLPAMLADVVAAVGRRLAARYAGRPTPAEVLRAGDRPLRAVVTASTGSAYQQYCARDVAAGLTAAGVDARLLLHPADPLATYRLVAAVDAADPDVLVLNGRGRAVAPLPAELCVASWDQDYVLCCDDGYAGQMGPRDRLMVMVADWREDAAERVRPGRTSHLNLGTDTALYHPSPRSEPEHEVLFVGNIHRFDAYRPLIGFDALPADVRRLMLDARDRLAAWVAGRADGEAFVLPDCDALLRGVVADHGRGVGGSADRWRQVVRYFRYRIAHYAVRDAYLTAVAGEFDLALFGRGWEAFPHLARHARGPLENGPPLREAIARSAVNLHLHTWTVHHPRLYDTAAAGGFLLVGRVAEAYPLAAVFDAPAEVETFGSPAELIRKVRHYLAHPDERAAIAGRAAARAARDHAMAGRMSDLVRTLERDPADAREHVARPVAA